MYEPFISNTYQSQQFYSFHWMQYFSQICLPGNVARLTNHNCFLFLQTLKIFSGKVYSKTVIQEGFLYFLFIEAIKLNQYRVTVGMFNNCNSAQCNSYNIWYNHSFRYCSSFILVSVIFIYLHYLFSWRCILAWCWRKSRTCMSLEFGQYFCALLHQIITFKGLCIFSKIWCNLYIWNLS